MTGENVFCAYCGEQTVRDGKRIIEGPCPCNPPALVDEGQKLQIHASLAALLGDGERPQHYYLGFRGDPDFYPSQEKMEMAKIAFYHLAGRTNPASIRVFLRETAFLYKELAEAHGWELIVHLPEGGVV